MCGVRLFAFLLYNVDRGEGQGIWEGKKQKDRQIMKMKRKEYFKRKEVYICLLGKNRGFVRRRALFFILTRMPVYGKIARRLMFSKKHQNALKR